MRVYDPRKGEPFLKLTQLNDSTIAIDVVHDRGQMICRIGSIGTDGMLLYEGIPNSVPVAKDSKGRIKLVNSGSPIP